MDGAVDKISQWEKEVSQYEALDWERMPEIYLYMDQVLTFMEKQLSLFKREGKDGLLTSSMINNYVKDGVLPRPEQKKYAKEHLALLTMICILKPVLSIPDISTLLQLLLQENSEKDVYLHFCEAQKNVLQEVSKRLETQTGTEKNGDLIRLAMELSIEAAARRSAAERILCSLSEGQEAEEKTEKK